MNEYLAKFKEAPLGFAHEERARLIKEFAWAVPSDQAIEAIRACGPIVEMGAGTGYWASLIGGDIICYDIEPNITLEYATVRGELGIVKELPGTGHWPVAAGGPCILRVHSSRALFLCWPPYNSSMAYQSLLNYRGDTVIYIGEGDGGCTGCNLFHEKLAGDYQCVKEIEIPQWDGLHDNLSIWKRERA